MEWQANESHRGMTNVKDVLKQWTHVIVLHRDATIDAEEGERVFVSRAKDNHVEGLKGAVGEENSCFSDFLYIRFLGEIIWENCRWFLLQVVA